MIFSFGHLEHEHIEIDVLGYERMPTGNYHDDNWLTARIWVCAGGFTGEVDAMIFAADIIAFAAQLRMLYESLHGLAEFTTLEQQLGLKLTGDGKGHVELQGAISDQPGLGNRLEFTLHLDQSQLRESVRQMDSVISAYPVRGTSGTSGVAGQS